MEYTASIPSYTNCLDNSTLRCPRWNSHAQRDTILSKLHVTNQQLEKELQCLFFLSVPRFKMFIHALDSLNTVCNTRKWGGGRFHHTITTQLKSSKQNCLQHLKFLWGILYPGCPWKKKKAWKTGSLSWLEGQNIADNLNQRGYEE